MSDRITYIKDQHNRQKIHREFSNRERTSFPLFLVRKQDTLNIYENLLFIHIHVEQHRARNVIPRFSCQRIHDTKHSLYHISTIHEAWITPCRGTRCRKNRRKGNIFWCDLLGEKIQRSKNPDAQEG